MVIELICIGVLVALLFCCVAALVVCIGARAYQPNLRRGTDLDRKRGKGGVDFTV